MSSKARDYEVEGQPPLIINAGGVLFIPAMVPQQRKMSAMSPRPRLALMSSRKASRLSNW